MVGPNVNQSNNFSMSTGNASAQSLPSQLFDTTSHKTFDTSSLVPLGSSFPFISIAGAGALNLNPIPPAAVEIIRIDPSVGPNVTPQNKFGFSEQVPAILSAIQFQAATDGANPTAVGKMIDFQTSARQLRAEDIIRLINELKANNATKSTIASLESEVNGHEQATTAEIQFLSGMARVLSRARLALRIKSNDKTIKDDISIRRRLRGDAGPVKGVFDVLTSDLLFSSDGVLSFSDTKVLATLIDDLLTISSTFSPALLDGTNRDRIDDRNVSVLTRLDDSSAQSFHISSIVTAPGLASPADNLTVINKSRTLQFLRAFDRVGNLDNRLRTVIFVLSKELRASTGLSLGTAQQALKSIFGVQKFEGNVFSAMIGGVGKDAFQSIFPSDTTLASVLRVAPAPDGSRPMVLPFESTFIDSTGPGGTTEFIPGSEFYVNSIVRAEDKFDTSAIRNIAGALNATVTGVATVMEGMLDIDIVNQQSLRLHPNDVLREVIRSITTITGKLLPGVSINSTTDIIGLALLSDSQSDPHLKHLLFVYLLVVGLVIDADQNNAGGNAFFASLRIAGLTQEIVEREVNALSSDDEVIVTLEGVSLLNLALNNISSVIANYVIQKHMGAYSFRASSPGVITYFAPAIESYLTAGPWEDGSTIIAQIISVMGTLDGHSREAIKADPPPYNFELNLDAYFSNITRGTTKFSGLAGTTMLRLVMEVFTILLTKYPIARFETTPNASIIESQPQGVNVIVEQTDAIISTHSGFNGFLSESAFNSTFALNSATQLTQATQITSDMDALVSKMVQEDNTVRDILDVLIGINNGLKQASNDVAKFFSKKGPNANQLTDVLLSPDADEKLSILDEQQVNLAQAIFLEHQTARAHSLDTLSNDVASSGNVSPFVDDTVIVQGVSNALLSMLREPDFLSPASDHSQILTVGLPAGFLNSLHDRLGTFVVGQDLSEFNRRANVRNDVIRINVHMMDHTMGDIVFKPLSFIFQMSRFSTNTGFLNVNRPELSFESMVANIITTRALATDGSTFQDELGSTAPDQSYSFLTGDQRLSMISNHIESYLLATYVKLLTGLEMQEDNFLVSGPISAMVIDASTRQKFISLLEAHVSSVAGQKLTLDQLRSSSQAVDDLLTRLDSDVATRGIIDPVKTTLSDQSKAKNIEISTDLVTFVNTFSPSSIIFGAGARRMRTVSPKKFERVFNILINPGDFEIDENATNSTMSGQAFLASKAVQDVVTRSSGVLKIDSGKRDRVGSVGLRTFFVTVDQLPELVPLDVKIVDPTPRSTFTSAAQSVADQIAASSVSMVLTQKSQLSSISPQQSNRTSLTATLKTSSRNFL